jgi:hypothetical protein
VNKASRCVNPLGMLDVLRRNVPTKLGKMLVILHVPISEEVGYISIYIYIYISKHDRRFQ